MNRIGPSLFGRKLSPVCYLAAIMHHTVLEFFDTIQLVTASSVNARHVVVAITLTQTFIVK